MSATVQPSAYQLPSLLPFHTSVPHSCRVTAHRQDFPTALGKPNAVLSGLCQSCPDKGISLSALLLVSSPRYISGCGYGCGVHQWVWVWVWGTSPDPSQPAINSGTTQQPATSPSPPPSCPAGTPASRRSWGIRVSSCWTRCNWSSTARSLPRRRSTEFWKGQV